MELAPNVPERFPRQGRTLPGQSPDFDRDHVRRAQANSFSKLTHLDDHVSQTIDTLRQRGTSDRDPIPTPPQAHHYVRELLTSS